LINYKAQRTPGTPGTPVFDTFPKPSFLVRFSLLAGNSDKKEFVAQNGGKTETL